MSGEMGQRPVSIYSRNESDSGWVLHARGVLGGKGGLAAVVGVARRWVLPRLMSMAPIGDSPNWAMNMAGRFRRP